MDKDFYISFSRHIPFHINTIEKRDGKIDIHLRNVYLNLHLDNAKQLAEEILKAVEGE